MAGQYLNIEAGVVTALRGGLAAALLLATGLIAGPVQGAFVSLEPDFYTEGQAIPDFGVKLRSNWIDPPSTQPFHRVFARATAGNAVGIAASTGSMAYAFSGGNANAATWNNGQFQATFDTPTNFASIDVLWPTLSGWSEGAFVSILTRNSAGALTTIETVTLNAKLGGFDRISFFSTDIHALRVWSRDLPGFKQLAWGIDNMEFNDTDTSIGLDLRGRDVHASGGLDLEDGDSLTGDGRVLGDVRNNAGTVGPGSSPGTIGITGDFFQGLDGLTVIDIGGSLLDQIIIDGDAWFGGVLELSLLSDFTFSDGQIFELISYRSLRSTFDEVRGLTFDGGVFELSYGTDSLFVTARASGGGPSPVPAPATLGLALLALPGLARRRRRA